MIRRAVLKDAEAIEAFLVDTYENNPSSGGNPAKVSLERIEKILASKKNDVWLYLDPGIKGILAGTHNATVLLWKTAFSANRFDLLAPDYALNTVQQAAISKALTLHAADDLRDRKLARDIIWVHGPYGSGGGDFARILGMSENSLSTNPRAPTDWYLPFPLIWERAEAVITNGYL